MARTARDGREQRPLCRDIVFLTLSRDDRSEEEASMSEARETAAVAACDPCPKAGIARTMYVHLCSGKVIEVDGVTSLRVTLSEVILERGSEATSVFARRDVYFACCDPDEPPFSC
jgi:hypothetical protein